MRTIKAREILYNIQFDLKRMLLDNTPTKSILKSVKERLRKIKGNSYQKVYWGVLR